MSQPLIHRSQIAGGRHNRAVTLGLLRKLGYESNAVSDGAQAVEAVKGGGCDLVLMDCQMPVMDGFEATRSIRCSSRSKIPIVAVTADALPADRDRCLREGMNDYLAKPLELGRLTEILAKWLPACVGGDMPRGPEPLPRVFRDQPEQVVQA